MPATVRRSALFALVTVVLAMPAVARAEPATPAPADTAAAPAVAASGPTVESASTAVRARPADGESAAAAQQRAGLGKPLALAFVGLGMFVAGAVVGNDAGVILMIGGAVIGLYGLYQYLQ